MIVSYYIDLDGRQKAELDAVLKTAGFAFLDATKHDSYSMTPGEFETLADIEENIEDCEDVNRWLPKET